MSKIFLKTFLYLFDIQIFHRILIFFFFLLEHLTNISSVVKPYYNHTNIIRNRKANVYLNHTHTVYISLCTSFFRLLLGWNGMRNHTSSQQGKTVCMGCSSSSSSSSTWKAFSFDEKQISSILRHSNGKRERKRKKENRPKIMSFFFVLSMFGAVQM